MTHKVHGITSKCAQCAVSSKSVRSVHSALVVRPEFRLAVQALYRGAGPHVLEVCLTGARLQWPYLMDLALVQDLVQISSACVLVPTAPTLHEVRQLSLYRLPGETSPRHPYTSLRQPISAWCHICFALHTSL